MKITVTSVDYAPGDLDEQTPLNIELIRELPGSDRPDYWLGRSTKPIRWIDKNIEKEITHVIICARWVGTRIEPHMQNLPIGIAYVTDSSLLDDPAVDFRKCKYIAMGLAHETKVGAKSGKISEALEGRIGRLFGMGGNS